MDGGESGMVTNGVMSDSQSNALTDLLSSSSTVSAAAHVCLTSATFCTKVSFNSVIDLPEVLYDAAAFGNVSLH